MLSKFSKWFRTETKSVDTKLEKLQDILGIEIVNPALFEQALRHRSSIESNSYELYDSYERLEFLGDAVLDLIVTEIIFKRFPKEDEGFLTKLRAKAVRGDTLALLATKLNLNLMIEVGERATGQGVEYSKAVLADIFESIVAAVYLTIGYKEAYKFVERVMDEYLDFEKTVLAIDNYKSLLLEYSQSQRKNMPKYRVITEDGPGHNKTFEVMVSVDGIDLGTGTGKSKKEAEQLAAKKALQKLNQEI
jgi:ribonuclease-3